MKLPRLQLHLTTCIILVFVAGGLIWANVVPWPINDETAVFLRMKYSNFGWPGMLYTRVNLFDMTTKSFRETPWMQEWYYRGLAINMATALAILTAAAALSEYLLRRRHKI